MNTISDKVLSSWSRGQPSRDSDIYTCYGIPISLLVAEVFASLDLIFAVLFAIDGFITDVMHWAGETWHSEPLVSGYYHNSVWVGGYCLYAC